MRQQARVRAGCVSQVTAGRKDSLRFEIVGSKCAVAWDSEGPNELWVGHRDRSNESLLHDPVRSLTRAGRIMGWFPEPYVSKKHRPAPAPNLRRSER